MRKKVCVIVLLILHMVLPGCVLHQAPESLPETVPEQAQLVERWECINDSVESVLDFYQKGDVMVGSWTYYNRDARQWYSYSFTIKEKTNHFIVFSIENGPTLQLPYTQLGHQLHINGLLYNNASGTASGENTDLPLMIVDGENYALFDHIYIGLHYSCVEAALPYELTELTEYTEENPHYKYERSEFSAKCNVGDDYLTLFFDANSLLIACERAVYTEELISETFDSWLQEATNRFGSYAYQTYEGDGWVSYYYAWMHDNVNITLRTSISDETNVKEWAVIEYEHIG